MSDYLDFTGPQGLRIRGTVLVVPGRGEAPGSYTRFGSRLAADAYRVRVLPLPEAAESEAAESVATALRYLADALNAALSGLDELVRPLILIGADSSAAAVAALVAGQASGDDWWPDALVLAGLPGYGEHSAGDDWESELDVRTQCPAHRGVLTGDAGLQRGSLSAAVPDELLDLAYGSTVAVPQLLLIGDCDPLADRDLLAGAVKSLPSARLSVVQSAHHDVLNDLQHRSVAAEVISFLEVARGGTPLKAIVTAESSAW
jgi:alpha-beta hydrolase superfamily lysophospholipase